MVNSPRPSPPLRAYTGVFEDHSRIKPKSESKSEFKSESDFAFCCIHVRILPLPLLVSTHDLQ